MHRDDTHKPLTGLLLTGLLALINYHLGDSATHDQFSAGIVAISFSLGALVILFFTERWTWRAVGVMIALAGTAIVYWLILGRSFGYVEPSPLTTRSILRASLDVGGVLLFLGLVKWGVDRRHGRGSSFLEFIDPRAQDGDQ